MRLEGLSKFHIGHSVGKIPNKDIHTLLPLSVAEPTEP